DCLFAPLLLTKGTSIAGFCARQQRRPGSPCPEKENAARRRVSRKEAEALLRKAVRAGSARERRSGAAAAQGGAQEGNFRRVDQGSAQEAAARRQRQAHACAVRCARAQILNQIATGSSTMRIFIFKSDTNPGLQAFSDDQGGGKLPVQFRPWQAIGVGRPDTAPPHNLNRSVIEASIAKAGFQLWRMKKNGKKAKK